MNYMFFLINIPWTLIFIIITIIVLFVKFYIDTKDLNLLTQVLENSEYNDSIAINLYKKYIKRHPLSIYNDMIRTLMIPPSISALNDKERKRLIKNNYLYFIPEQLNDFIIFCCFILKENRLDAEYDLFTKKIISSPQKRKLQNKIQVVLSSNIDDNTLESNILNSPILKSILYFNTAVIKQNCSKYDADEYFKKCYELCGLYQMKNVILKRGGKIE